MKELSILLAWALSYTVTNGQNLNCNFDNDNFCAWTQVKGSDNADWQIRQGPTPSQWTGPPNDHTTNSSSGYYIYYEANNGNMNDKAQLQSPRFSVASGKKCLSFWYYMYGPSVNALNVYLKTGNALGTAVFHRERTQGQKWNQATITITNKRNIQVIIEAVRGRNYLSDIGVDDILFTNGACGQAGSVTPPPGLSGTVTCNFETSDICGYKQSSGDDQFDWKWATGATPTKGTGPPNDHTQQSAGGHYMLMESNGHARNQKCRLLSPITVHRTPVCLQFYYYMYGRNVNRLSVYTKTNNRVGAALWSRNGNQGQTWQVGQITLNRGNTNYQVVFEAVRGNGNFGDIAIDDVIVHSGRCPSPGSCDFEKGLCTWTNSKGDDFDWISRVGSTTTQGTGPTADHTLATGQGHYIYIEASSPRRPNDKAQLISQTFTRSNRPVCFQFWYSMVGATIGSLNIYKQQVNGQNTVRTLLWSLSGNQQQPWMLGKFSLTSSTSYQIVIEGVRGSSITGDIAIDDIKTTQNSNCALTPTKARPSSTTAAPTTTPTVTVSTGRTTTHVKTNSVTCNFDYDLCGWTQLKTDQFDWTRQKGGTILPGTGPTGDHTSGKGYYMYTAASVRYANQTAQIQSPQITPRGKSQCLTFWYHMYGPNIGVMNLYVKKRPTLDSPLWTRAGDQGNQWQQGVVTLPSTGSYSLVFESINGYGFRGDMGLDDVTLQSCTGISTPKPGVSVTPSTGNLNARKCTFEQTSICGYRQDKTDNFDWTRDNQGTVTSGTGPSRDHTYGTTGGHYMYIETSAPRKNGDKARLMSPLYQDSGDICVNFWYHMFGSGIGTLNVYAQVGSNLGLPVFTMSGNQGNKWVIGSATVPQSTASQGYKIVFEGIRGTNYRGDIAIDDVTFSSGSCGNPGDCDFDNGLCTWSNVRGSGDNFDWTQQSGKTASGTTGPTTDHTQGNSQGKYMFIETSSPRRPGDIAWLASQMFQPSPSGSCVSFWYSMYGATVDTLNVYVVPSGSSNRTIWRLSGNQGQQWLQGQAPIPVLKTSYKVIFEGVRGRSYTGDIAIDDISFSSSTCGVRPSLAVPAAQTTQAATVSMATASPSQANCTFDTNLCGWTQDKTDNFDWSRQRGSTASSGTGPSTDHSGSGFYIYIETSGQRQGSKARLISPQVLPLGSGGQKCVKFWYHMYGQNVASLNLYIQFGLSLPASPRWTLSGTQGNQWKMATLTFTATKPFNMIFEGVRGNGYKGDIAVDDVTVSDGACSTSATASPIGKVNNTQCDFESRSICGFTQSHGGDDKFDWSYDNGGTSSTGTGPTVDHTLRTRYGHYMYIEASAPRRRGDNARLLSPIYNPSTQPSCLKFWYSMYGRNMGTLNVYTVIKGVYRKAWTRSGNQGNAWNVASLTVPASSGTWQIVFEGIVGNGIQGDIAIDDYSVTPGSCSGGGPKSCNFDQQNLCTWTNDQGDDQFDWQLRKGSTPSGQTGPSNDHTKGNSQGYYIFIEASAPRITGDRAWLISEGQSPGSPNCLSFWYNMNGNGIGALRVWVWAQNGAQTPIWELKGRQGTTWLQGKISIPAQTMSYKIIMEGTRGTSYAGDIALDDISFTNTTSCPRTPQNSLPSVPAVTPTGSATTRTTPRMTAQSTNPTTRRSTAKPTETT